MNGIPGIEPLEQEIAPPIDDGEEVVEVVGDAPREAADRFHLLALAKLGFAVAQRLFRAATRDGDPRDVRSPLDDETVGVARAPRLRVVHGEGAEDSAVGGQDRRRPAGAEIVGEGEVAEGGPERIGRDVRDHDGFFPESGRSAGPDARADGGAVDRLDVRLGETGGRTVTEMHAVRIEQEDGTEHAVGLGLDDAAEGGEHLGQLDPRRNHLQELPLAGQDRLRPPSLAEVTDVAGEHGRRIGADAGDGQLDGKLGPVRAHRGQLDPLADRRPLSRGQVVGQAAPVAVTEGGRHDQLAELAADRLAPRVAEGPLGGRIELQDLPRMVHGDDAIERRVQDRPHAVVTLAPVL